MVLLTLGALFTRSFLQVAHAGAGFDTVHTIIAAVHDATGRDTLARRLAEVPGVLGVTSIQTLPFMGELPLERVRREGDPAGTCTTAIPTPWARARAVLDARRPGSTGARFRDPRPGAHAG